jgi:DNA-directed RNA polymerase subunit RPC12/RpoP
MDDLISRQTAIDAMINSRSNADVTLVPGSYTNGWIDGRKLLLDELLQVVFELPSAQPERTGHWVEIGDEPYDEWECDRCGFEIDGSGCVDPEEYRDIYIFCPHCGAMMLKEGEEQNESKILD